MADKDYSQLTSATTASDADLFAIYPVGGPLKKLTFLTFKNLVITALSGTYLTVANNLSDIASASSARANLALGTAAQLASSALFQVANNLSEVASAPTARMNLGAAASDAPTITSGMTLSGAVKGNSQALSGTSIDVSLTEFFTKAISADTTFTLTGTVGSEVQGFFLRLTITSAAAPTFTGVLWDGGAAPVLGNGVHLLNFVFDGSSWYGAIFVQAAA